MRVPGRVRGGPDHRNNCVGRRRMKLKVLGANRTEIELPSGLSVLYSYSTPVAVHVPGVGYLKTETRYSVTTSKHIGQWLDGNVPARIVPQSEIVRLAAGGFYLTP